VATPELVQPGRHAGHAAGCDPDRVVDELGAEGHLQLEQLGLALLRPEARDGHEAVEVLGATAFGLVVDRVTAAEQARHHVLGNARRERGGNRGVRRRSRPPAGSP
jgi:2-keto-3-deoxy-L-rhamnonate aldolase RhmA